MNSRHDVFISSSPSSSSVMKNCPLSVFFEKPALEQSLVNFSLFRILRIAARFLATSFPVHPRQSEKQCKQ